MRRIISILAVAAVMAAMLVASAAPALARVEQEAVEQVVNQAQVAVKETESPATYQAVEQAQNSNRVASRRPIQSSGSTATGGDALFLVGTVALLIAGGVLTNGVIRWQSQRR